MSTIKLVITYKEGKMAYSIDKGDSTSRSYIDDLDTLRDKISLLYGFKYSGAVFSTNDPYLHYYVSKNNESVEITKSSLKDSVSLNELTNEVIKDEALFMIEACKKLQKQLLETQYEKEHIFEM